MSTPANHVLDEWLVLQSQDGDARAMDELVRRWHPRLLRHAWHLTHHSDAAAEVTQESWLAIVHGIGGLRDPAVFRSWAYRIVTHKCTDWTRRRREERHAARAAAADSGVDRPPHPQSAALEADDEAWQLHQAIRHLSPDQRAILSLRYWEAMSTAEMATVLGVPEGTIKSRLNTARSELKQILERSIP